MNFVQRGKVFGLYWFDRKASISFIVLLNTYKLTQYWVDITSNFNAIISMQMFAFSQYDN